MAKAERKSKMLSSSKSGRNPERSLLTALAFFMAAATGFLFSADVYSTDVTILTTDLPYAVEDLEYEEGLIQCTGGYPPYSWAISAGTLPGWASGPAASGGETDSAWITGTPAAGESGSTTFTVEVTDDHGQTASQELTLVVTSDYPPDYWTYTDLPDLTDEDREAFIDKTPEEWDAYYLSASQDANDISQALEDYILDWYYGDADPTIPNGLLPPSIDNAKTMRWTLMRPEDVQPEDQWYIFPSHEIPSNYVDLPSHTPDPHATYLKMIFIAPFGSQLLVEGDFPYCRFMDYQVLQPFDPEYIASGGMGAPEVPIVDVDIDPDPGHVNPFRTGADRNASDRHYHLTFEMTEGNAATLNPGLMESPYYRSPGNSRAGGPFASTGAFGLGAVSPAILWVRYYAPDDSLDPFAGVDLPRAIMRLSTGETFWIKPDFSLAEARQKQLWSVTPRILPEPYDYLGSTLGWFKVFGILLHRTEYQAYGESLPWGEALPEEKKSETRMGIAGLFKRGPAFDTPGNLEAGATMCNYTTYLTRPIAIEPGHVLLVTGKLPTTPDTRNGQEIMTAAEVRYWSISRYVAWSSVTTGAEEEMGDGICLGSLMDDEITVDGENRYIVAYSLEEDRPDNAVSSNGVTWQSFSPTNFGFLAVRWTSVWPDHFSETYSPHSHNIPWKLGAWSQPTYDSSLVGANLPGVMGPYHPVFHYMTREEFEAMGASPDPDGIAAWQPESNPPDVDRILANGAELTAPYLVAVSELDSVEVEIEASDPDGDPLSYAAYLDGVDAEEDASYNFGFDPETRLFQWDVSPGTSRPEPYELILVVSDGLQSKTATVNIAVDSIEAPVVDWIRADGVDLSEPYEASLAEQETIEVEILASDPDGDPLTYSAWVDGLAIPAPGEDPDSSFTFDPATRIFQWTPPLTSGREEPYVLTFGIEDGVFTTLATVEITVTPLNPPAVDWIKADGVDLTEPYEASLAELETIEVQIQASDLDGDPLTYSAWVDGLAVPAPWEEPDSSFTFDPTTRIFQWTPPLTSGRPESYELTFGIEDGVFTTLATVQTTVTPLSAPAVDWIKADGADLTEPYEASLEELATIEVQIQASDLDGDPLVYNAWIDGFPVPAPGEDPDSNFTFDPTTRILQWTPQVTTSRPEPYELTFGIEDGVFTTLVAVQITVTPLRPPVVDWVTANGVVLEEPYRVVIREQETLEVQFAATSPWGGDPVLDAYFNGDDVPSPGDVGYPPEYYSFDPETGLFSLIPMPGSAGDVPSSLNLVAITSPVWSSAPVEVHVRPSEAGFECPECVPLAGGGAYGKLVGGDETHADEVNYNFDGVSGDVTVAYEAWDVDDDDEVEIMVNGLHVGYVPVTSDEAWSGTRLVVLADTLVFDSGTNVLTFSNTNNPPNEEWWGVRDVSIWDGCPECIPLPDSGAYGRISGGDQTHVEEVNYRFDGVAGDVTIVYEVWDVDFSDEVEILVNGVHLAYAETTANVSWSGARQIVLPDEDVLDSQVNILTFNNTRNPPLTYAWGVGNVSILEERDCTDCIALPDAGAYGRISGGDQTHVEEVNYSFEGVSGDVTIVYEAWDVDFADEVEILVNGVHLEYTSVTPNSAWSGLRSVVLPDGLIFDSGMNVLTFNNGYNPPKTYAWGVGNVFFLQEQECPDCIPLPDTGDYGKISGGDPSHVEEVSYSFEGVSGDVTVTYEVWDVDFDDEVEIIVNGIHVGYASVTPNVTWSDMQLLLIPDGIVFDGGTNVLTFSNTFNPPKTYAWGVGKVSILQEQECLDCIPMPDTGAYGRISGRIRPPGKEGNTGCTGVRED